MKQQNKDKIDISKKDEEELKLLAIEYIKEKTNEKGLDASQSFYDYVILKTKTAKLDEPPASCFITKKGNKIRELCKYGPGEFNWASTTKVWDKDKQKIRRFHITDLTDQNWTKDKIKRAAEKKVMVGGLKQYMPQIMIGAVIVMFIIAAWFLNGTMQQGIAMAGSVMDKAAVISLENAETAKLLAGISTGAGGPPPGI